MRFPLFYELHVLYWFLICCCLEHFFTFLVICQFQINLSELNLMIVRRNSTRPKLLQSFWRACRQTPRPPEGGTPSMYKYTVDGYAIKNLTLWQ